MTTITPRFPDKKYQIIYADPPWSYNDKASAGKRGASFKYPTMSVEEICALPVSEIAADNCVLFLWVTPPFIFEAQKVIEAWGFTYKTKAFNWVKYTINGKLFFGMGNWTRSNSEDCLLAIKGKPSRQNAGVPQVIRSRVLNHSVKPPETRDRIVRLIGDLPRIELFARQAAEGWDSWGLDAPTQKTQDKVKPGDTIAVWFSSGAASAVAAKRIIEKYGDKCRIRVINNPVIEEHEDNKRFLNDVEKWLGIKVETAINSSYRSCSAVDVWNKRGYMSGVKGAPCTLELKKKARKEWEENNTVDWHVLGFTSDEAHRASKLQERELPELLPILVDEGITKQDCFEIINNAGIQLPKIYKLGYPNANCIGCVKATSPTYWNHVRKVHPKVFQERAEQSRKIGVRLVRVKGKRIFLDELDPDAKGRPMKGMRFDCGIFCEDE